jgi:hypothetical protein
MELKTKCDFCGKITIFECQQIYREDGIGPEEPAGFCKCTECGHGGLYCPNARGVPGVPGYSGIAGGQMTTFVFILSADRVLVIQSETLKEAMDEVKKDWYPGAFEDSFEVKIATGVSLKEDRNETHKR